MTDNAGNPPPFPGFPGFPSSGMLDQMWNMMRLSPFASAFPGASGSAGGSGAASGGFPSLSMMSDMMAPLTNVEEMDKRITDMRAVEQWLKLNLNMLQSAIQALEVQRATLATLRAFGAFAQSSMQAAGEAAGAAAAPSPSPSASPFSWMPPETGTSDSSSASASASTSAAGAAASGDPDNADVPAAEETVPFDASAWWNLLQTQFNQIAQFAMTQPAAAASAAQAAPSDPTVDDGDMAKPAAKRAAAKKPAVKKTAAAATSKATRKAGN